jgi:hypothetical protein
MMATALPQVTATPPSTISHTKPVRQRDASPRIASADGVVRPTCRVEIPLGQASGDRHPERKVRTYSYRHADQFREHHRQPGLALDIPTRISPVFRFKILAAFIALWACKPSQASKIGPPQLLMGGIQQPGEIMFAKPYGLPLRPR